MTEAVLRTARGLVDGRKEQDDGDNEGVREITIWEEPIVMSAKPGTRELTTVEATLIHELSEVCLDVPLSSPAWPHLLRAVYFKAHLAYAITPATRARLTRRKGGRPPAKKSMLTIDERTKLGKEAEWLWHLFQAARVLGMTHVATVKAFVAVLRNKLELDLR